MCAVLKQSWPGAQGLEERWQRSGWAVMGLGCPSTSAPGSRVEFLFCSLHLRFTKARGENHPIRHSCECGNNRDRAFADLPAIVEHSGVVVKNGLSRADSKSQLIGSVTTDRSLTLSELQFLHLFRKNNDT